MSTLSFNAATPVCRSSRQSDAVPVCVPSVFVQLQRHPRRGQSIRQRCFRARLFGLELAHEAVQEMGIQLPCLPICIGSSVAKKAPGLF